MAQLCTLYDMARVYSANTGNSNPVTLGAAVPGFMTFGAVGVPDGGVVSYGIIDGVNSEGGRAVYANSGTTLTLTPIVSTNGNNCISRSNTAQIFVTALAEDIAGLTSTIINVPADYANVNMALNAVRAHQWRANAAVTISVANGSYPDIFSFLNEDLSFVTVQPASTPTIFTASGTGNVVVSGSARNWAIVIPLTNANTNFSANDYVCVVPPNANNPSTVSTAGICGYWKVTAANTTTITIFNTCSSTLANTTYTNLQVFKPCVLFNPAIGTTWLVCQKAKSPSFLGCGIVADAASSAWLVSGTNESVISFTNTNDASPASWLNGCFFSGGGSATSQALGFTLSRTSIGGVFMMCGVNWYSVSVDKLSKLLSRGCIINGGLSTTAGGVGLAVDTGGVAVLSPGGGGADLPSISSGHYNAGIYAYWDGQVFAYYGAVLGNGVPSGSVDIYALGNSDVFTSTGGPFNYGSTNPAINTLGNVNAMHVRG